MPRWLIKQLKQAYISRDRRQIKYLNDCWLSFQNSLETDESEDQKITTGNI